MAAGLGFKDFVTGEVLTAADVDGYLMQNIWVFANATARDAAVTSPQEGNACYLKDTDAVMTYSGSAWVAVGSSTIGNPVLNSAFQVWQRGTSTSIAASTFPSFPADRWITSTNTNQACTVSRQATGDTTNLPNIQYALRYQRNSGQTGTGSLFLIQNFESINSIPFAGKNVTLSFYARKGANYSATSSALGVSIITGTGTDQNAFNGFTGSASPISSTATLTTTWQRFSYTGTIATNVTQIAPAFLFDPTGTAGAADYYEVTGVQIDVGSAATPFKTYAVTIQGELAACQRYYWRIGTNDLYQAFFNGVATGTTTAVITVQFPVLMRVPPTSLDFAALGLTDSVSVQNALSGAALSRPGNLVSSVNITGCSGLTQYRPVVLSAQNSLSAYIGASAEL